MIKNIIRKIKSGYLTRDTDESGKQGLWDLAGELSNPSNTWEQNQESIYNALWEVAESIKESEE